MEGPSICVCFLLCFLTDREVVKKTRGGRRKRKREIRRHHKDGQQPKNSRSNYQDVESGNQKVLQTLRVTSDDSEEVVAREIAYKLNEVRILKWFIKIFYHFRPSVWPSGRYFIP